MAVAGPIGTLVGGIGGMISSEYQAKVAEMNKKVARQNARVATETGGIEAQMNDSVAAQQQGEQLAQQAASGVSVGGESQIRTRAMARFYAGADRARTIENARKENHNYKVDAANFQAEANSSRFAGKVGLVGSALQAYGEFQSLAAGKGGSGTGASATPAPTVLGKATTAAPPKPTLRPEGLGVIPKPRMRPLMPTIGRTANPLIRTRNGF